MNKKVKQFGVVVSLCLCMLLIPVQTVHAQITFVDCIGDISQESFDSMLSWYCMIPLNVRENFQIAGWRIVLTTETFEDTYEWYAPYKGTEKDVCAFTDITNKEIRLENTNNGRKSIVHEVGHYVDISLGYISNSSAWGTIWNEECSNISAYAMTNTCEGFAEAFKQTFCNGVDFQKKCPKSYQFIIDTCNQIQGVTN